MCITTGIGSEYLKISLKYSYNYQKIIFSASGSCKLSHVFQSKMTFNNLLLFKSFVVCTVLTTQFSPISHYCDNSQVGSRSYFYSV